MALKRRYIIFLAVAACILLLGGRYHEPLSSAAQYHFQVVSSSLGVGGKSGWAKVPLQYPVESPRRLPTADALPLPKVQCSFPYEKPSAEAVRKQRLASVAATFEKCWGAYKKNAWMQDELTPISGGWKNGFGGWAATLVDSLDMLYIMGLETEFDEAVRAVIEIDLSKSTTESVNVFETTIRHLGGLLSAYDLSGDVRLLRKAKEFGEMLLHAFDTPNHLPITRWKPQGAIQGHQEADEVVLVAELGSLSMEFTHLSQLTGDMRYFDAVDRITLLFYSQQNETLLPGMWPVSVNARDADLRKDPLFTLNAMADSVYEYLPKMHALLGGLDPLYGAMYDYAMSTAASNLLWKPMTPEQADILISGTAHMEEDDMMTFQPQGQHLGCFVGGMFALGAKVFDEEVHLKVAKRLTDGCIYTYKASPMGIMPEVFTMVPCPETTGICKWDERAWHREVLRVSGQSAEAETIIRQQRLPPGFTSITDRRYILRPEAIESVFLLYRITGESYLMDAAWDMFQAIQNASETDLANAALADITYTPEALKAVSGQIKLDSMESFWLAETLKYFYLIFSDPELISLDEWVFNTEAHPFKRPVPQR